MLNRFFFFIFCFVLLGLCGCSALTGYTYEEYSKKTENIRLVFETPKKEIYLLGNHADYVFRDRLIFLSLDIISAKGFYTDDRIIMTVNSSSNVKLEIPSTFIIYKFAGTQEKQKIEVAGIRKNLEKEKIVPRFVDGGVFTYPGLEKATWDVIGLDNHHVEGTINFTLPKTPTLSYHIGQSLNNDIIKNIIKDDTQRSISDTMGPLANFVLPSIKSASDVLEYTDPVRLGPYTFRVLKNSKFKEHEVIGKADYDIYQAGRIKAVLGKQPLAEGLSVEKKNILYSYLRMIVEDHGLKGHKRLQYATVWNNSVPALYFEAVKENSTLFGMVLYDNQNIYTYYLYKPHDVHVSNYKLRDVIQYVDIKSSKGLFDKATVGIGFTPNRIQFMEVRPDNKKVVNDKK